MLRLPFTLRPTAPEIATLRAVITLQAALIGILMRLRPDATRHLSDEDRRNLATVAEPLGWRQAAEHLIRLVTASTLRRWYRLLVTATPKKTDDNTPEDEHPSAPRSWPRSSASPDRTRGATAGSLAP